MSGENLSSGFPTGWTHAPIDIFPQRWGGGKRIQEESAKINPNPWTLDRALILIKTLDPLRAKKTFIRKKLGHTAVLAIKASSVTL